MNVPLNNMGSQAQIRRIYKDSTKINQILGKSVKGNLSKKGKLIIWGMSSKNQVMATRENRLLPEKNIKDITWQYIENMLSGFAADYPENGNDQAKSFISTHSVIQSAKDLLMAVEWVQIIITVIRPDRFISQPGWWKWIYQQPDKKRF